MTNRIVDAAAVYLFVSKLVTPFNKWPAFSAGIIDENGNVLRRKGSFSNSKDHESWGYLDILASNIKKLLAKVPGGSSRLASIGAAALLLRDDIQDPYNMDLIEKRLVYRISEEAAANAVGGGNIAGIGVGPAGEPGRKKRKKKVADSVFRRGVPQ